MYIFRDEYAHFQVIDPSDSETTTKASSSSSSLIAKLVAQRPYPGKLLEVYEKMGKHDEMLVQKGYTSRQFPCMHMQSAQEEIVLELAVWKVIKKNLDVVVLVVAG